MKRKKIDLDVDFIGGQDPLTLDEEKALRISLPRGKQSLQNTSQIIKL